MATETCVEKLWKYRERGIENFYIAKPPKSRKWILWWIERKVDRILAFHPEGTIFTELFNTDHRKAIKFIQETMKN